MKKLTLSVMFILLGAALGCQPGGGSRAVSDSYEYEVNGCNTGKHSFSGSTSDEVTRQLCAALQDDERNKGCALELRIEAFRQKCVGHGQGDGQGDGGGSQDDKGGSVVPPSKPAVPVDPADPTVPALPSQPGGPFKRSYRFNENGCDTGLQEFRGVTEADALAQYCLGLSDDRLNNHCAKTLRSVDFIQNCKGASPQPTQPPAPGPGITRPPVLPPAKPAPGLTLDPEAMTVCQAQSTNNDKVLCMKALQGKSFADGVIKVCKSHYSASLQKDCLVRLAQKALALGIVETCKKHYSVANQEDCLDSLAGKAFDPEVQNICSEHYSVNSEIDCLKDLAGQAFPPEVIKVCRSSYSVDAKVECLKKVISP